MSDTVNRGYKVMDKNKQNDMPTQDSGIQSNQDMNEQGEKGGMSQSDQNNSNNISNDTGLTEETGELDAE